MLIPYQVDVPMSRWPYMNFLLIGVVTLVSLAALMGVDEISGRQMVLTGWSPAGMFGHMLLHADMVHLIGNMLFLWVFGNAVCAKITNTVYLPFFVALGLVAAPQPSVEEETTDAASEGERSPAPQGRKTAAAGRSRGRGASTPA